MPLLVSAARRPPFFESATTVADGNTWCRSRGERRPVEVGVDDDHPHVVVARIEERLVGRQAADVLQPIPEPCVVRPPEIETTFCERDLFVATTRIVVIFRWTTFVASEVAFQCRS